MKKHFKRKLKSLSPSGWVMICVMSLLCALILIPMALTFLYSFFSRGEISAFLSERGNYDESVFLTFPLSPAPASIGQYYEIFIEDSSYLKFFLNSVFYTGMILLGQALIVPLTAYALSRFSFRGRDLIFFIILILMILPFQVTMAPSVMMLRKMNLMDTVWAVILPMCFSPLYIFLIRQFMVGIPNELLEADMVDGVGPVRGFIHVILPVCKPVIGAACALSFADSWNLVEQPLLYLANREDLRPLSVMFNRISTDGADIAFAGATLYILPTLFVYLFFQENIVSGIQLTELK